MVSLALAIGWILAFFIAALEVTIVVFIWQDKINIAKIISDENGDASLSRFQFLIFTFVISMSLFLIIVSAKDSPRFPDVIPVEILGLLGISGGTYALAKSIQASRDTGLAEAKQKEAEANRNLGSINGSLGTHESARVPDNTSGTKSDQFSIYKKEIPMIFTDISRF